MKYVLSQEEHDAYQKDRRLAQKTRTFYAALKEGKVDIGPDGRYHSVTEAVLDHLRERDVVVTIKAPSVDRATA